MNIFKFQVPKDEQIHWKRPWCWERLRARGEGEDRGWDDWVASLTQWTWIWANSRKEIAKARKACCAAVRGLQRAGHDLTSEQQQTHPGAFISRSFTNFASCKTLFLDKNTFWGSRWTWISMDLQTNAVSFPHESRNFWRRLRSWLVFWICVLNEFCLWIQKWWWWWWEWGVLVVARVVVDREKGRMEGNTERTWEF